MEESTSSGTEVAATLAMFLKSIPVLGDRHSALTPRRALNESLGDAGEGAGM